jgi:hypothetical protein
MAGVPETQSKVLLWFHQPKATNVPSQLIIKNYTLHMSAVGRVHEISLSIQIFKNPKLGHIITFMCGREDRRNLIFHAIDKAESLKNIAKMR